MLVLKDTVPDTVPELGTERVIVIPLMLDTVAPVPIPVPLTF